jgi:hypothetical protein
LASQGAVRLRRLEESGGSRTCACPRQGTQNIPPEKRPVQTLSRDDRAPRGAGLQLTIWHLVALADQTRVLEGVGERAFIDIDSLLRPVYGHTKQGASFGHTKIAGKTILRRGLSPLAVTICTATAAPVLAGVRLRAGRAGSAKGAASMVTEAINTAKDAGATAENILIRGDSALCSGKVVAAVVKAGATFSFAIARNPVVGVATIGDEQYTPVRYRGRSPIPTPAN